MTVKELVEKLKEYPDDMDVYVCATYKGRYEIGTAKGLVKNIKECLFNNSITLYTFKNSGDI